VERLLSLDPPIARQHLEWARTEVNKLKHDLYGRLPAAIGRQHLDVANAEAAVNELIGLMERPDIKSRLSERFRSLPPP
jgi:multidrug resistance efflux pump